MGEYDAGYENYIDGLNREIIDYQIEVEQVKGENAKLRELVRDMYGCVSHANEQDWFYFERHALGCGMSCTVNGEACGLSVFADRLCELGVDV